ncbi:MAG: hypothetical protein QMC81_01115 [Thermoanaerobacterales bacterium]|nr:hypothetical protein [Bacillota bacterium]MDI6906072.1 hypothetical protein [Thermoanaerobacterales bacterium]
MTEKKERLSADERKRVRRFSAGITAVLLVLALVTFWGVAYILQDTVFTHYFDPQRHTIVEEAGNGEVLEWQDGQGNVYTPEDPQTVWYPVSLGFVMLFLMGICYGLYVLMLEQYIALILVRRWYTGVLRDLLPATKRKPDGNKYAWS